MTSKIFVSCAGSLSKDVAASKKQAIADALGVCCEDIILVPDGMVVSVLDIPDSMIQGYQKADKEAATEAEKVQKAQEAADLEAIKAQQPEPPKVVHGHAYHAHADKK